MYLAPPAVCIPQDLILGITSQEYFLGGLRMYIIIYFPSPDSSLLVYLVYQIGMSRFSSKLLYTMTHHQYFVFEYRAIRSHLH